MIQDNVRDRLRLKQNVSVFHLFQHNRYPPYLDTEEGVRMKREVFRRSGRRMNDMNERERP